MHTKLIKNITKEMKRALEKESKRTGSSTSEIVRRAIRKYLGLK